MAFNILDVEDENYEYNRLYLNLKLVNQRETEYIKYEIKCHIKDLRKACKNYTNYFNPDIQEYKFRENSFFCEIYLTELYDSVILNKDVNIRLYQLLLETLIPLTNYALNYKHAEIDQLANMLVNLKTQ